MKREELIEKMRNMPLVEGEDYYASLFDLCQSQGVSVEKYKAMEEAMAEFVKRCDEGSVRSKYTYAKFKDILAFPSPPIESKEEL